MIWLVQRSAVAFVIVELLRMLDEQVGFLRPYALVGHDFNSSPNHLVRSNFFDEPIFSNNRLPSIAGGLPYFCDRRVQSSHRNQLSRRS